VDVSTSYKIRVCIEPREDGGLRVWSDDLPELVLSHADAEKVIADIPRALEAILSERLGAAVQVEELAELPPRGSRPAASERLPRSRASREFAARAA
jgi:hypothetical protein